ncbi:MAG TPA: NAD(P)/FAD-dependent oxidoreductase [Rhizomicrobium sp.]|nr:NAD(P)/FAD-dependent oxidoreductase [Rhizomicrobium sp.]
MSPDVVIVGAGFTGLSAALRLTAMGRKVVVLEADSAPGGLAGTAAFGNGVVVEKFYHHWFTNDEFVMPLIRELGLESRLVTRQSRTGMYYNRQIWRLSKPRELLAFSPLSLPDRIRLGLMVLRVRRVKDWKKLEHLSIREWLEPISGKAAFRVVWEPLINSKFSIHAERVNAVWMWNKLLLRGSSRDKKGAEQLAYFRGGFGALAEAIGDRITAQGGSILYNTPVTGARADGGELRALIAGDRQFHGRNFLITTAFPIAADILAEVAPPAWLKTLRRIHYLGNVCLVLQLDRSLSDTYWLNVNDPGFPFVGVIEHTNFDPPTHYKDTHIVYLSRYLAKEDPLWGYSDSEYFDFALTHLARMFPQFQREWVIDYHVWRAEYAQPIPERNYSRDVPGFDTPLKNCHLSNMAQIYPEDRGTNYAIREGFKAAALLGGAPGRSITSPLSPE